MSGNTQVLKKPLSRVGRRPVLIPKGVEVQIKDAQMTVRGPKGSTVVPIHPEVHVTLADNSVTVSPLSDDHKHRALHGLTRSLINNAVIGVTQGYRKSVEVRGVGYRAQQSGKGVTLAVGYSHPVEMQPPDGIAITVEGTNFIHISGADKQKVGEMAARIRAVRSPSPYMEKGLRYVGETPRTKPGKRAASAGGQQ